MRKYTALLCSFFAAAVWADTLHCPLISDISRVSGEYAWQSNNSLWEGYFVAPFIGRGDSSEITTFLEARWVQLTNLAEPKGIVECDYAGNAPGEIIRFVLLAGQGGPKPSENTWSCIFSPPFPSTQCTCAGEPGICAFEKS